MDKKELDRVLTDIDDELVAHAAESGGTGRSHWNRKWLITAGAAAAVAVIGTAALLHNPKSDIPDDGDEGVTQGEQLNGAEEPDTAHEYVQAESSGIADENNDVIVPTEKEEPDSDIQEYYLAKAPAYNVLSADERAAVELGMEGIEAIHQFTSQTLSDLYQISKDSGEENFLYSPTSLYLALAVLAETENTEAAAELYELLGVSDSSEMTNRIQTLMTSLMSEDQGDICQIGNSIWFQNAYADGSAYPWKQEAYDTFERLAADLNLDLFSMDLHSQEAGEMRNIWIREHTDGLLGDGEPEPWSKGTCMVIMNSIYFDKDWREVFDAENTYEQPFYKAGGEAVTCEMMHSGWRDYGYLQTDTYLASALPYKDNSYMLFLLPEEGVDVGELLKSDLQDAVTSWQNGDVLNADLVNFAVPKLDYSVCIDKIIDQLSALGISAAFSDQAFTNLADTELFVSSITQTARIQVNECGTRAAAFTEIETKYGAAIIENIVSITLDRPYAYAIVSANGTILFTGVVNNPTIG